jgi:hypothetical protein
MSAAGANREAAYPQPVIPVDQDPHPWQPPSRRPALVSWDENGTVRIHDPDGAGGSFHCVWTVELVKGTFTLTTETTPRGEEGRFQYQLTPDLLHEEARPFGMRADPTETEELRRGAWTASLPDIPDGWRVTDSSCSERGTALVTTADGALARLGIDPGDEVECTFRLKLLTPRPGSWRADNKKGRLACDAGGVSIALDANQDVGRLSVRQDGDVLRGRGGPGRGSFTLRRDRDDPFVYRGTLDLGVQGQTVRTRFTLRMVSERRLEGDLIGSIRVDAGGRQVRCVVSREVVMTHVGEG